MPTPVLLLVQPAPEVANVQPTVFEVADAGIDVAKADAWIKKGAHASETVRGLIDRARRVQA